jgi:quercetin dioxygenase-like cupin family protein
VLGASGAAAQPAPRPKPTPPTEEQRAAGAIERALKRHAGDVHRCFEKALADRLDVAGKVELEVQVAGGGKVTDVKILSKGESVPPALAACVQAAATAWTIEGIEAGASVVLPLAFQAQAAQFVVKSEDAPDRGPPAGPGRGGVKVEPAFKVKILADPVNVRAQQASLTLLTVGPASRVAMHRHPRSAKLLYVLSGHARLLGPPGTPPIKLDEGSAVFLPMGYPHVIENMGRQQPVAMLQAFSPPGPERAYRDPKDPAARADFEVLRDPSRVKVAPSDPKPVVVTRAEAEATAIPGTNAKLRVLLDPKRAGSQAFSLAIAELPAGAQIPRTQTAGSAEIGYVTVGGGELLVGSEGHAYTAGSALFVPAGQPRSGRVGPEPTTVIRILSPAAEQAAGAAAAPAAR